MATGRRGRGGLRGTIVTTVGTNQFEACACGYETRFADRGRPRGQTVGLLPIGLVLMLCFVSLPDYAPLNPDRLGSSVRIVRYDRLSSSIRLVKYGRVVRAVNEVVAKSRRNPDEFALDSLRIRGATALAAGRYNSELE